MLTAFDIIKRCQILFYSQNLSEPGAISSHTKGDQPWLELMSLSIYYGNRGKVEQPLNLTLFTIANLLFLQAQRFVEYGQSSADFLSNRISI